MQRMNITFSAKILISGLSELKVGGQKPPQTFPTAVA
jgi:hypothetical protein